MVQQQDRSRRVRLSSKVGVWSAVQRLKGISGGREESSLVITKKQRTGKFLLERVKQNWRRCGKSGCLIFSLLCTPRGKCCEQWAAKGWVPWGRLGNRRVLRYWWQRMPFAWVGLKPKWQIRWYNLRNEEACERHYAQFWYSGIGKPGKVMNKGMHVEIWLEKT